MLLVTTHCITKQDIRKPEDNSCLNYRHRQLFFGVRQSMLWKKVNTRSKRDFSQLQQKLNNPITKVKTEREQGQEAICCVKGKKGFFYGT